MSQSKYVSTIGVYGNLREKPEKWNKRSNVFTVSFHLALNPIGKRPGDNKGCTWYRVVCFEKPLAARILREFDRGDYVYVTGELSHNSFKYKNDEGEWKQGEETQIIAKSCEIIKKQTGNYYDYEDHDEKVINFSERDDNSIRNEEENEDESIEKFSRFVKEMRTNDNIKNIFDDETDEVTDKDIADTEVPEDTEVIETEFKDAPF